MQSANANPDDCVLYIMYDEVYPAAAAPSAPCPQASPVQPIAYDEQQNDMDIESDDEVPVPDAAANIYRRFPWINIAFITTNCTFFIF